MVAQIFGNFTIRTPLVGMDIYEYTAYIHSRGSCGINFPKVENLQGEHRMRHGRGEIHSLGTLPCFLKPEISLKNYEKNTECKHSRVGVHNLENLWHSTLLFFSKNVQSFLLSN